MLPEHFNLATLLAKRLQRGRIGPRLNNITTLITYIKKAGITLNLTAVSTRYLRFKGTKYALIALKYSLLFFHFSWVYG